MNRQRGVVMLWRREKASSQQLAAEIRGAAAVKWYEMGVPSQGKAAELAGLSRAAFLNELSRFGVTLEC